MAQSSAPEAVVEAREIIENRTFDEITLGESASPSRTLTTDAVRYFAYELGPKGIRVHAISPGLIKTRAASGIANFDALMEQAASRAPARRLVTIEDVGVATAVLATDYAKLITGETVYVDGGYHILG